jgi:hypothetical protein
VNILIFNQGWFADDLRLAGHTVVTAGPTSDFTLQLHFSLLHIDSVLKCLNGFSPDVIIYHDNSMPLLVRGLEETDIPTIFYSVDAHHHFRAHSYQSLFFDHTFVAQRDYLPHFRLLQARVDWLPLWASRQYEPSDEKKYAAVFVGNLCPTLHPQRAKFLEALAKEVPVHFQMGNFWEIFPHAHIVLNQTVKGDLNFRVFEAMMSGSLLLTERGPNGLDEIFTENTHMVTYERSNVAEAADKIRYFLAHPEEARAIGHAGRAEVMAKHRERDRVAQLEKTIRTIRKETHPQKYMAAALLMALTGSRFITLDRTLALQALATALQTLKVAMQRDEIMDGSCASHTMIACAQYDQLTMTTRGADLLAEARERFPQWEVLHLAHIRNLLNTGREPEARKIAATLVAVDPVQIYAAAENVIVKALAEVGTVTP